MELRHLRYFIAAAEEEHFGRASDRLHVTRPAVSQLVADLEDELGTALFERQAHRVRLTAAGRALLPEMQAIMSHLNQALVMARRVGEGRTGALRIGYGSLTLLHPLFKAAVKEFHQRCPDVTLSLLEIPSSEQGKALAEGRIDAAFQHFGANARAASRKRSDAPLAQDATAYERLKIQTNGLGAVVPPDHPLAGRKLVSLADLAQEQFVVIPHSAVSPSYGHLFALCQKSGFEPRVVQEVNSITSMLNLVSVGMGIGLSVSGKDFSFPLGLTVLRLQDVSFPTTFALVWVKGQMDPVLERFVETVRDLI
ncbi:MAG: LysR substrate-binding domain-containing protein [Rubrivivax sp.]